MKDSLRTQLAGFASGLLAAGAVSGGLAAARLTLGDESAAFAANLAASLAAVILFTVAVRARREDFVSLTLVPQVAGVLCGTLLVHAWLIEGPYQTHAYLSEKPRQLVNDFVASFSILAAAWACARRSVVIGILAVVVLLVAYRLTTPMWHLDGGLFGAITVQQLVLFESLAALVAVLIFRAFSSIRLH
ncbi:MAG TPA: hypothetical protein VF407_21145 [Polyangiaceae bacterium]